jgi:hypothetical protein
MPHFAPIKHRELVQCPHQLGYRGPFVGGTHQFVVKGRLRIRIPNPYREDIGKNLLSEILREAGIAVSAWEEL